MIIQLSLGGRRHASRTAFRGGGGLPRHGMIRPYCVERLGIGGIDQFAVLAVHVADVYEAILVATNVQIIED